MSSSPHIDREILTTLRDVMGEDFNLLIETFINDSSERISNLHQIIPQRDSDTIRRAAHSFKGSSSNIGAAHLAELCSVMENLALAGDLDTLPLQLSSIEAEFAQVISLLQKPDVS